ncbi:MAG: translation initiation factor IF-2 [Clostridia bacterium]|nr:translation initiation factor IF-2 [Clostridia bacterium]
MATKVKLADATKELNTKASKMLEDSSRVKRNVESVLQSLRKKKSLFARQEAEAQEKKKLEEQELLSRQHTKAWVMLDEEQEAAQQAAQKEAKEAERPAEKPAEAAAAKAQPVEEKVAKQPAPAEEPKPVEQQKPAEATQPATAKTTPTSPQQIGRPVQTQRTTPRPAPQTAQRPATPGSRATGIYANRPAGQYGQRSATGQYGSRPAGQYGARPAGQGGYNRPAQGGQGGQYGARPAVGGQYGRPAGGPDARPQGAGARPQGNRPGAGRSRSAGIDLAPAVEKERVSNYDPNKKNYQRQHDPEHVAKNRKQLQRESFNGFDDDTVRGGKRSRVKKPSAQQLMAPIKIEKAYMTADTITVKDLTERIGKPAGEILKKLLMLGIMSNINSELDFDTASLVCSEFGVTLEMKQEKTAEDALEDIRVEDKEEDLRPRPPVVTIMGHVDHGKTTLLDYIRKSKVAAGEAGGITQHIGAYTVKLNGEPITFLDTPGHEAFTAMRLRGAQATDIAILVVAADDGVMPQTVEAINHARAANVPIVVAINKMDKAGANPDRVMQDLTKYNLVPEAWGGETIMVPVSAVTGDGVDELLEMVLLQADILQLRANPDRLAMGVVIEAKLDKARGPLATVLLKNGTLHVGDNIVAGMAAGKVRAMTNDRGERVKSAGPSMPVEISGFEEVPVAGEEMTAVGDDRLSRQVAQERRDKLKASRAVQTKVSLDNLFAGISEGKVQNLNVIIKADVQGSVEAVKQSLEKLSNDSVKVHVLHSAVGAITQDDVNLASAFNAIIIGFNIRPDSSARAAADKEGIDIRLYRIIYQAIEDIEKAMKGMLEPEFKEVILGHAQVRNVFKITGAGTIAGAYVTDGKLMRNASVRLLRDNVVVFEGKLSSLRRFKDDVHEVSTGYECGASLENYGDIKENDVIECFNMEKVEA